MSLTSVWIIVLLNFNTYNLVEMFFNIYLCYFGRVQATRLILESERLKKILKKDHTFLLRLIL